MNDTPVEVPQTIAWAFDEVSFGIGMMAMFIMWLVIGFFITEKAPLPLTDIEILAQTDVCNHQGRLAQAVVNKNSQITKVFCTLPPYKDKRDSIRNEFRE